MHTYDLWLLTMILGLGHPWLATYLTSGITSVTRSVTPKKPLPKPLTPRGRRSKTLVSPRRLVGLLLKHTDQLEPDELSLRDELLTHPVLSQAWKLAQDVQRIIRQRQVRSFETCCTACEKSQIPEWVNFAAGMRQDPAVKAACRSKWSNGQTEGQVNRLKMLKRQM